MISKNLDIIQTKIEKAACAAGRSPSTVKLVAVSKKKSVDTVREAIKSGQTLFGENYIQEAVSKIDIVADVSIKWHFIGHLQKNKAKFAVKYFDLIHTVDSFELASEISRNAFKIKKIQNILVQVKTGNEDSKSGVEPEKTVSLIQQISSLENVRITGLMTIPPPVDNPEDSRIFFRQLKNILDDIRKLVPEIPMTELSMGMSDDFETAISEGATLVRVGTAIFGERN